MSKEMREVNGFGLGIGTESGMSIEVDAQGYTEIQSTQTYMSVKLRNSSSRPACATVRINDKTVAEILVRAESTTTLYNPTPEYGEGKFEIVRQGSQEWGEAGMDQVDRSSAGVVSVSFQVGTMEESTYHPTAGTKGGDMFTSRGGGELQYVTWGGGVSSNSHQAVGVGLSGNSTQSFTQVEFNEDFSVPPTTIEIRLVERKAPRVRPIGGNLNRPPAV